MTTVNPKEDETPPKWVEMGNLRSSHRTHPYSLNGSETGFVRFGSKVSRQRFRRRCQLCKRPAHIRLAHTSLRIPHRTRENFLSWECLQLAIPAIQLHAESLNDQNRVKVHTGIFAWIFPCEHSKLQPEADGETQKLQARDRTEGRPYRRLTERRRVSHRSPRFARQG